jgi:hypothetical protein
MPFEQEVYQMGIAFDADMPLIYFLDRPVVLLVVIDGEDHRTLPICRLESPFNTDLLVTRLPFAFLGAVMGLSELIHKLRIGDV